jgi:DDE superfamily endonuclease
LLAWLELFEDSFGHRAARGVASLSAQGLLSDSRRKSMEAMWARLSDPGSYQALQHFITHAPWDTEQLWTRLRAVIPERTGVLILDGTWPRRSPTRPQVRAVMQDVLTAHLFITQPHYLKWMLELKEIKLQT